MGSVLLSVFSFLKTLFFLITIHAMSFFLFFLSLKSPKLIEISLLMKIVKERRGLFALKLDDISS